MDSPIVLYSGAYWFRKRITELQIQIRGKTEAYEGSKQNSFLTSHIMISVMCLCVLFQLSVLTGVRFLQTSLENVLRQGDPNCESDGWLLENSFIETARINLNIIKNLGKCNQIDTANNGDPNINVPSTSKAHYGPDNVPPKETPEDS